MEQPMSDFELSEQLIKEVGDEIKNLQSQLEEAGSAVQKLNEVSSTLQVGVENVSMLSGSVVTLSEKLLSLAEDLSIMKPIELRNRVEQMQRDIKDMQQQVTSRFDATSESLENQSRKQSESANLLKSDLTYTFEKTRKLVVVALVAAIVSSIAGVVAIIL